jgi:hypothetical protein
MLNLTLNVRRIPVRLPAGPDGLVEAVLFLAPPDPRGSQGLLGRLNDHDGFVPASIDGKIKLLAKSSMAMLACLEPLDELSELEEFQASSANLRVRLRGGAVVAGLVRVLLPGDRQRPLDFLNHPDRFFPLVTEFGTVVVNKDWIESVEQLEFA